MRISIIIPVYHEENNILNVLEKIHRTVKNSHEILIIYDSKKDPTYDILKKQKNTLFRLIQNEGQGVLPAIKTGFAKGTGEAIVVVMADLADDVSQIDKMYQEIQKGADVVAASRYMPGGKKIGGAFLKSFLSKMAGLSLYYFFHIPTHDATNAFKMYRKEIFRKIRIETNEGFVYSLEIIIKAYKTGLKITEIPTTWKDREEGKSNFKLRAWLPSYIKTYAKIFS